jgi:hypothetical protein
VEDVRHPHAGAADQLGDLAEHLGQSRSRDHPVLHDVVGADPAHRGERGLAALPEQCALGVVERDPDLECTGLGAALLHRAEGVLHLGRRPVQLDDQHRAGAFGVTAGHRGLGGLDRERVHHLDRRGHHPVGDDHRHGRGGLVHPGEAASRHRTFSGARNEPAPRSWW